MGMKVINAQGFNPLLFCGHDLPFGAANNGHYLRVYAIVMAMEKENKQGLMAPLIFSSLLGL